MPDDQFNLVFRFKRGDDPTQWKCHLSENVIFLKLLKMFTNPWSEESGYPSNTWNDSGPTQQFAIKLEETHLKHHDFTESIKFFIDVANCAVNRNWEDYKKLTRG